MPRLTRRHARALAAGAATTALYLAGARVTDSRYVRGGALLTVMLAAVVSAQDTAAVAKNTKKRLDQHVADTGAAVHFVNHGGTISGPVTITGALTASGGVGTSGAAITTSGGNLSMGTGDITCQDLTATGTTTLSHVVMSGGNINMGGNNVNNSSAYVVAGAPHRADLGAGATLAQVQARCDFFNDTLISEGLLT